MPESIPAYWISGVANQIHKPEIHVELRVTVKERKPWIVRHEIDLRGAEAAHQNHVLHDACNRLIAHFRDFKRVPVQVQRMKIAAVVVEQQAIALSGMDDQGRRVGI